MAYELRTIHIRDIQFAQEEGVRDGVLFVNQERLRQLVAEDRRVQEVRFDLAKPGDSCRILPVKDVIEPRAKLEGEAFPGLFRETMEQVGTGVTYVLKGCAVVTTGPIVGFQEGLIDMSGPGAEYTIFSKLNNLVMHITKASQVDPHEHEEVVRLAGIKVAHYLGKLGLACGEYDCERYDWPPIGERFQQYPELPKVVYVCNCMAQGLLHDTYLYGRDCKAITPTLLSPLEYWGWCSTP